LEHLVADGPDGDIRYHVCLSDAGATVVRGPAATADVTFAEDYATAAAVASGSLSAAAALLAGRIRVAGDVATLVEHQPLLRADPLPPAVRAATTY
jgi:putative sterol carrier protein